MAGLDAACVFGALRNLGFTVQIVGVDVPSDALDVLPFVLTIVALIIISARPGHGPPLQRPITAGGAVRQGESLKRTVTTTTDIASVRGKMRKTLPIVRRLRLKPIYRFGLEGARIAGP